MTNPLRLYVPVYTATLTLSAFLLFAIQPLFGKMILPMMGGSPAVWNTAMVFFQAMLLGGYAYAHATSRWLAPRTQAIVHVILLMICTVALPLAIPAGWREPPATDNPAFWQLAMMTVAVGGPFFVLSGTAPMLQRWFSFTGHADAHNPYFLYAASNFGSMSALLLYPFLFEPMLTLNGQSMGWTGGYALLILMTAACALLIFRQGGHSPRKMINPANDNAITMRIVMIWLLLSFTPSSLMLGVTTYITTDLASIPLLWIIPLTLYISTFIIAFARVSPVKLSTALSWQGLMLALVTAMFASGLIIYKPVAIISHLVLLFLSALACHMQLAALRPEARHLTAFYLVMSAGGVLGGMFNALLAPQIFAMPIEYALVLGLSAFLRYVTDKKQAAKLISRENIPAALAIVAGIVLFFSGVNVGLKLVAGTALLFLLLLMIDRRWAYACATAAVLLLHPGYPWHMDGATLARERNFFGVLRVADAANGVRIFSHGTTLHGAQPLDEKYRLTPISYYYKGGGAGDIFEAMNSLPGPQNIAVLGLGIGCVACFSAPGRHFDFYEIDPDVVKIAENKKLFTYLSDCGSPYDVIIGDARLKIEKMPDRNYDMVFLDVFSSDNIPVHVMTKEAFQTYLAKLKPGGMIGVNISNRYLDLEPVIAAIARDLGLHVLFKRKNVGKVEGTDIDYAASIFAVLSRDESKLSPFTAEKRWYRLDIPAGKKAWRDDYSNLVGALRTKTPTIAPE